MRKLAVVLAAGMCAVSMSSAMAADEVARNLKGRAPSGPTITTVAKQRTASPGELIEVDVYISNVNDLSLFQVALEVVNDSDGSLALEELKIQKDRKDFVFGDSSVVSAEHLEGARMGAVLTGSSVDVGRRAYLGTYKYRASVGVTGTFKVQVKMGKESFLRNSDGTAIAFLSGKATSISIGEVGIDQVPAERK